MNKLRSGKRLTLLILGFLTLSCLWERPLTVARAFAQLSPGEEMARGQTPQELGSEYIELLYRARDVVSTFPAESRVKFPLGVNSPVRITDSQTGDRREKQLETIGFVNGSGQPQAFTARKIVEMLDRQINNSGGNSEIMPENVVVADASGGFVRAQRVPAIDLIIVDPQTREGYLVKRVRWIGVFRDALNAALNEELEISKYDVNIIDLRRIEEPEIERI